MKNNVNCAIVFVFTQDLRCSPKSSSYNAELILDGANGVGAEKAALFKDLVDPSVLKITIVNDGTKPGDVLNQVSVLFKS